MTGDSQPTPTDGERVEHDWSHDLVLRVLQTVEEPVGSFVRAFPGRVALSDERDWLENWFIDLAERFRKGEGPDLKEIVASGVEDGELSLLAKEPVKSTVRLVWLRPHWFRGFRQVSEPIRFESDLIIVEGRNSSGKTSISEALEWVFTGQLSRRTSGKQGHPTELADCIVNEFRPDGEETRVELAVAVDGDPIVLERVLTKDYSTVASDIPQSDLLIDGERASRGDEQRFFDRLFAGVHPILMQHNLRQFVHDEPSSRRQYFERLLQIEELTALVEKAVIGRKRAKEIPNPSGGTGLAALRGLASELESSGDSLRSSLARELRTIEQCDPDDVPSHLVQNLMTLGDELLGDEVESAAGLPEFRARIENAQQRQRESRLPLLASLENAKSKPPPSTALLRDGIEKLKEALGAVETAKQSAGEIAEAEQQIARAADQLIEASLLDPEAEDDQQCPVCEDGVLTPGRVAKIVSWGPLARAVEAAQSRRTDAATKSGHELDGLRRTVLSTAPEPVDAEEVERQLKSLPQRGNKLGRAAHDSAARVREQGAKLASAIDRMGKILTRDELPAQDVEAATDELESAVAAFSELLTEHRRNVDDLQEAVGAASRDDARYRLRENWLKAASLTVALVDDVAWEAAKVKATASLDGLREGLIELRTEIVEDARRTFSEEMTEIWGLLRADSGASFSQLHIPPARGKGFKLEFGLKAMISDGNTDSEVDALRVFSESQVNVVGIAAYVTRANRLGHKLLIFDDPVQSMDEEHFRSFAANLVPVLIDNGHQVVILTHSNSFGSCINEHHFKRESYATLKTRSSKRRGCYVDEGTRRVSERLRIAEKVAEDGELEHAWRLVRLAIERMCLLVKFSSDDSFKPESWYGQTAEAMWNEGVEEIIENAAPGKSKRLKEILKETALGAHDKTATSETDLKTAVKDLRALLDPLRLGAG